MWVPTEDSVLLSSPTDLPGPAATNTFTSPAHKSGQKPGSQVSLVSQVRSKARLTSLTSLTSPVTSPAYKSH